MTRRTAEVLAVALIFGLGFEAGIAVSPQPVVHDTQIQRVIEYRPTFIPSPKMALVNFNMLVAAIPASQLQRGK